MELKGKVAIVTGASRGIGRGIALCLAREGMAVAAVDLSLAALDGLVSEIKTLGGRVLPIEADVSSGAATEKMAQQTLEAFGQIDVLVNNAGVIVVKALTEMSEHDWDKTLDVNLKGLFLCSKAIVPHMISRKSGRIVNVSSVAGKRGYGTLSAYCASKFGAVGFTQSLAQELGPFNIGVNAVCPGYVDTAMWREHLNPAMASVLNVKPEDVFDTWVQQNTPLGRPQSAQDIGECVLFLCKADNVSGVALNVDGGAIMT